MQRSLCPKTLIDSIALTCLCTESRALAARSIAITSATMQEMTGPVDRRRTFRWQAAGLAGVLALAATTERAAADPAITPCDRAATVPWTALHFTAHKFLLTAAASLTLELEPASRAQGVLRAAPTGSSLAPQGPCVAVLTFASRLPIGRDERAVAWLDPRNGTVFQVDKRTVSGGLYRKVFRYTSDGYFMWRTEPADRREAEGDADAWSKRKTEAMRGRADLPPTSVVTDSYALLYVASAASLDRPGARTIAYMLDGRGAVVVTFAADGLTTRPIDLELSWPGGSEVRERQTVVRTVTVTAAPLGGGGAGDDVDLGFLGIRGALTIAIDVATGLPIELAGRAPQIGTITASLRRAELAAPPESYRPAPAPTSPDPTP